MEKPSFSIMVNIIARLTVSKTEAEISRARFSEMVRAKSDSVLASIICEKDNPEFYRTMAPTLETDARHAVFFVEAAEEELKHRTLETRA